MTAKKKSKVILNNLDTPTTKPRKYTEKTQTVQGESMTVKELFQHSLAQGALPDGAGAFLDMDIDQISEKNRPHQDLNDIARSRAELLEALENANKQITEHKQKVKAALEAEKLRKVEESNKKLEDAQTTEA